MTNPLTVVLVVGIYLIVILRKALMEVNYDNYSQ